MCSYFIIVISPIFETKSLTIKLTHVLTGCRHYGARQGITRVGERERSSKKGGNGSRTVSSTVPASHRGV